MLAAGAVAIGDLDEAAGAAVAGSYGFCLGFPKLIGLQGGQEISVSEVGWDIGRDWKGVEESFFTEVRALVKKFVSDKVQFFSTNSTIQSWGCVKREKVLNPGGRWGLWNCARMRLTDEKGGAMGQASWRSSFLGQRSAKFFAESESCGEQPRKSLLWQSSRPLLI